MAGGCQDWAKPSRKIQTNQLAGRLGRPHEGDSRMSTKIIVSYDGTANEEDAIALGQLLGGAGGEVSLAYVRHNPETDSVREEIAQAEAQSVLDQGVELLGTPGAKRHVVTDRSTPQGLASLAEREGADVIVFCSD